MAKSNLKVDRSKWKQICKVKQSTTRCPSQIQTLEADFSSQEAIAPHQRHLQLRARHKSEPSSDILRSLAIRTWRKQTFSCEAFLQKPSRAVETFDRPFAICPQRSKRGGVVAHSAETTQHFFLNKAEKI